MLNVDVNNIIISMLVEIKSNYKYFIRYLYLDIIFGFGYYIYIRYYIWILDKVVTPLVLILSKMSGYVMFRHLKLKMEIKIRTINLSFRINGDKLSEKYKTIWTKIESLKNIELNVLPVYDDRYLKTKIRTYGDIVYTNLRSLNVLEDDTECKSFTFASVDYLLVYDKKIYLLVYLDNCASKIVEKQIIDYLDDNLFATNED